MAADCDARCVDGADLGTEAPYANMIANADPHCPVHGDPQEVQRYIAALEKVAALARRVVVAAPGATVYPWPPLDSLELALRELDGATS